MKMGATIYGLLLRRWHRSLDLPRQSPPSWYRMRVREELQERRTSRTFWRRLSETSDVFFSISRARYDDFPVRELPPFTISRHTLVYAYMLYKYSMRWAFYRTLTWLCGADRRNVREVVNPAKDLKLVEVALRHDIEVERFCRIGRRLRRVWPLLP